MSIASVQELLGCDVIVLVGAPLAGKSTQGNLLGKVLERPYVSSGDLFRAEVALVSDLGRQIKAYMDSGELIPNELTTEFLTAKLSDPMYQNGMILDGYPRNLSHLPIIEGILTNLDRRIFTAIHLDVSKSQLDERRLCRGRLDDNAEISERTGWCI
jgi:adenylate kinase